MKDSNYETRKFDDGLYWCPFRTFKYTDCRELTGWLDHYEALGIRTRLFNRYLWVHIEDDKAIYDRPIPASSERYLP